MLSERMELIADLTLVVAAALAGGFVARRAGQPLIVGYILVGVLIGPFTGGLTVSHVEGIEAKWDWEGAIAHVAAVANRPDGLPEGPGAQAKIEEIIMNWFIDSTGDAPTASEVRRRASKVMSEVRPAEN